MDQLNACFSWGVLDLKDVSEFFEGFAQMGAGAVDGGFNGGDAGAEGLRDFLVAEVLLLKEQDGLPLFGGQIVKGAVKGFFNFGSAIFGAKCKLLTGAHFSGGILGGHILVKSGGRRCTCGAVGCLESEASGWVLPELVRSHHLYGKSSLSELDTIGFKELFAHATLGDTCARAVQAHCLIV